MKLAAMTSMTKNSRAKYEDRITEEEDVETVEDPEPQFDDNKETKADVDTEEEKSMSQSKQISLCILRLRKYCTCICFHVEGKRVKCEAKNFLIRNGRATMGGGGIWIENMASPHFLNVS